MKAILFGVTGLILVGAGGWTWYRLWTGRITADPRDEAMIPLAGESLVRRNFHLLMLNAVFLWATAALAELPERTAEHGAGRVAVLVAAVGWLGFGALTLTTYIWAQPRWLIPKRFRGDASLMEKRRARRRR